MAKSIKKNFIWNVILTASSLVFPLITFPYVSRVLGPEGTGKVALAISVIAYFDLFAQLGIPIYGIRVCAKVREDREKLTRTAHELLLINLCMTLLSFGVLVLGLIFVPKLREERLLYLVVSATMFLTSVGMEWLYKALEQYTYIAVRSLIFKLIALVGMFLLIHVPDDYVIYGAISIFATSAANILNFICAYKHIGIKPVGGYQFRRHFKAIFIFFAMSCATTVYTNLDTVMLGFMKTDVDVGYYNAAVKVKNVLVGVVTSLGAVLLPRASFYIEQGMWEDFRRISKKALNFVFVLATPLLLYFMLFAEQSILLLCGAEYDAAVVPMQIIMPTLLFIGLTNILGIQMLVPLGKEKIVLYSELAGAVVDLILNAIFIPMWGAAGAALGTLVAELAVLVVQFVALKKEVIVAFRAIQYYKILPALAAGVVASFWVAKLSFGVFMTLLISACLFFGAYGLVLLITRERLTISVVRQFFDTVRGKLKRTTTSEVNHDEQRNEGADA